MLDIVANGKLITSEFVEVEMLKMLPAVPVETLEITLLRGKEATLRFLFASVTTREEAVRVARFKLPILETVNWLAEPTVNS